MKHEYSSEELGELLSNKYHARDHEVQYLQERLEDAYDTICRLTHLMSEVTGQLQTEIELFRADGLKEVVEQELGG